MPKFLEQILTKEYGEEIKNKIIEGYDKKKLVTLRVNTLKENLENIKIKLNKEKIKYKEIEWYKDALIIENVSESNIKELEIYKNGKIYMQSLSSMIPPIILEPKQSENILDMAAAPGGKTTQIAAISSNKAMITACEKNKIRAERLKFNIEKQGARVNIMLQDARKLDDYFAFDKILLDSPCSGSGTENIYEEKFNEELIRRTVKIQEELLKKAIKILKTNGELVYSTCSILKEENEEILNKVLKKEKVEIIPIKKELLQEIPMLPVTIDGTICVLPNNYYEGFFIAKLKKKG